jgi:mannan endo-1,4-beta-mannosidase
VSRCDPWIVVPLIFLIRYGKPATLSGFGLVTNATSNSFAPFNSSGKLLLSRQFPSHKVTVVSQSAIGTTETQQVGAYNTWTNAAITAGVQGVTQYQWGVTNITNSSSPALTQQSGVGETSSSSVSGFDSPNDGYAAYDDAVKGALQSAASQIGTVASSTSRKMARWEF